MIKQLNLQYLLITSSYSFIPSIFSPIFSNCYFLMYSLPHLISPSTPSPRHPSLPVIQSHSLLVSPSSSLPVSSSSRLPVSLSPSHLVSLSFHHPTLPVSFSQSHCYVSFNRRMSLIIEYLYIFKFEIINIFNIRI